MRVWKQVVVAAAAAAASLSAASGQVVISQVNGAGGLTTGGLSDLYDRDFVELFNRGSTPVSLNGWSLQLWGDTGNATTVATPNWDVIPLSGTILPGQYFLVAPSFQRGSLGSSVISPPLPAPDVMGPVYDGAILVTSINAVALMSTTMQIPMGQCPSGPDLVDLFRYAHPNGLCFEGTASAPPNVSGLGQAVVRNNGGCSDTNNSSADLTTNQDPMPRNSDTNVFVTTALDTNMVIAGTGGTVRLTATRGNSPCNPLPGALTSASADLSAFGLSASQALFDDGTSGDLVGGDGIFSVQFSVSGSQAIGTYVIPMTGASGATSLAASARLRVWPQAASNDLCSSPIDLSGGGIDIVANGPYSTVVNTFSATSDGIDAGTCNGDTDVDFSVWYSFTATAPGALRMREDSTEDVVFSVHASCASASSICMNREDSGFSVTPGTTYLIQVGRETGAFSPAPQEPLQLTFTFVPVNANDTACTAETITTFPFTAQPYAPSAGNEPFNIACDATANPGARHGVWYTFVAPATGVLEIYERSINPTNFVLFSGGDCSSVFETQCKDESLSGALISGLSGGTTYWLLVSYDSSSSNPSQAYDFTINFIPSPPNDECAGATDLNVEGLPFADTVNARFAATDANAPSSTGTGSYNACGATLTTRNAGVWYRYTTGPTVDGTLRVADFSTQDVFYTVFTGSCGALTPDQCYGQFTNDDIFIRLAPNTTYSILVSLASTTSGTLATGDYMLTFTLHPTPPNDLPCNATLVTSSLVDVVTGPAAMPDVDVSCNYNIPAQSTTGYGVWYRFAPATSKLLQVRNTASDVLVYGLFTGASCSGLSESVCRMGSNGQLSNNVAWFELTGGTEYWLLVGKIANSQPFGFYNLEIDLLEPSGACCAADACTITTQAACTGSWKGAFTTCGSSPNYSDAAGVVIPDATTTGGNTPGVVTRTITITDSGTIDDLKVLVELDHGRVGDLVITLQGPSGATQDLIRRIDDTDGGCPNFNAQGRLTDLGGVYIFDDQSANPYGPSMPPAAKYFDFTGLVVLPGHYQPTTCGDVVVSLVQPFLDQSITGTWTLTVSDEDPGGATSGITPTLHRWGLIINGGASPPCGCIGDFNNSGSVSVQDIFDFLTAYFANDPAADINDSGGVSVQDIFDFLAAYFAGCD